MARPRVVDDVVCVIRRDRAGISHTADAVMAAQADHGGVVRIAGGTAIEGERTGISDFSVPDGAFNRPIISAVRGVAEDAYLSRGTGIRAVIV